MPTTTEVLTEVRDAAHLNQHALVLVGAEAQTQFDTIRTWPDSPAKESTLRHLGRVISTYSNAQREALQLRDDVAETLASLGAVVPDLPATNAQPQWSRQDW